MKKSKRPVQKIATPISPLQLRDYSLLYLHIETNADFHSGEGNVLQNGLGVNFDFKRQEGTKTFRVDLDVVVNYPNEMFLRTPYRIRITLQSIVEFEGDYPEEQIPRLLGPNGLAMTYAIARGIVGQATGASPHGKFILPTVNFVELIKEKSQG
jgi:preprotein translocase subunit SecB